MTAQSMSLGDRVRLPGAAEGTITGWRRTVAAEGVTESVQLDGHPLWRPTTDAASVAEQGAARWRAAPSLAEASAEPPGKLPEGQKGAEARRLVTEELRQLKIELGALLDAAAAKFSTDAHNTAEIHKRIRAERAAVMTALGEIRGSDPEK